MEGGESTRQEIRAPGGRLVILLCQFRFGSIVICKLDLIQIMLDPHKIFTYTWLEIIRGLCCLVCCL